MVVTNNKMVVEEYDTEHCIESSRGRLRSLFNVCRELNRRLVATPFILILSPMSSLINIHKFLNDVNTNSTSYTVRSTRYRVHSMIGSAQTKLESRAKI